MTDEPLDTATLRHIATYVRNGRRRLAETYAAHGREVAEAEFALRMAVESRPKFTAEPWTRVQLYALALGLGRELDRLNQLEHAKNAAANRPARGYVSPALAAAAP